MNRTDIYTRFKLICECHTAAKQQNEARCFAVGREYEVNADNVLKGDIQNGNVVAPKYFYSKRWAEGGKVPSMVVADYPMVFLTAGDRKVDGVYFSVYEFDLLVFDLMFQDRNNFNGNETALREKEDIWQDTENIMLEIATAYQDTSVTVYNDAYIAFALGFGSPDRNNWSVQELADAAAYYANDLLIGTLTYLEPLSPFEYDHNNRLAGVSTRISIRVPTDCVEGSFLIPNCL